MLPSLAVTGQEGTILVPDNKKRTKYVMKTEETSKILDTLKENERIYDCTRDEEKKMEAKRKLTTEKEPLKMK